MKLETSSHQKSLIQKLQGPQPLQTLDQLRLQQKLQTLPKQVS